MAIRPVPEHPGYLEDTSKKLILPAANVRIGHATHAFDVPGQTNIQNSMAISSSGLALNKDETTGIPFWPVYASGFDDLLMRAMVQGYMANVSQTPLPITLLSALVSKIQGMVGTWLNTCRGKKTPVKKILDIMASADDSQFGAAEYVRNHLGAMSVDNRGSFGAQVPIGTIDLDGWGEYGMDIEPIAEKGKPVGKADKFILRMTTEQFRENRGLWSIDGMYCWPTGVAEWPYWIRKEMKSEGRSVWILIHRDYGFQITQQIGPKNSIYPGFGQSGAWRFSPYAIKQLMIDLMDWEHLINQPMRGIVWVSGLDSATQFRDQLLEFRRERDEAGVLMYPGVFFGGSRGENSKISLIPWAEPPAGYTPESWNNDLVSKLAASFHMNETHLQLKLGEGALTQSGVAESLEAETAISWMRQMVEMVWNHIAPPRVIVRTIWHSDKTRALQVETFMRLSRAISLINKPNPNAQDSEKERLVLSRDEIRALIEEYIGIEIPELLDDEEIASSTRTGEDLMVKMAMRDLLLRMPSLSALEQPAATKFAYGNVVAHKAHGWLATIERPGSSDEFVWVRVSGGGNMLVSASSLVLLKYRSDPPAKESKPSPRPNVFIPPHKFQAGETAVTDQGNQVKISNVRDSDADVSFAWTPEGVSHPVPLASLIPLGFEPEGQPLPPPERSQIRLRQNRAAITEMWQRVSSDPDLMDEEWDEGERLYTIGGSLIPHEETVDDRDEVADEWGLIFSLWPTDELFEENVTGRLLAEEIALDEWEAIMGDYVALANQAQYVAGRGGFEQLSDADDSIVSDLIYTQLQFLNAFALMIASGQLSEQQIAARSRLYFSDTVHSFEAGYAAAHDYRFSPPVNPGDCTSECCAGDRCFWLHVDTGANIESVWMRRASESCPTCLRRAACPPLIFNKLSGTFLNEDCYL